MILYARFVTLLFDRLGAWWCASAITPLKWKGLSMELGLLEALAGSAFSLEVAGLNLFLGYKIFASNPFPAVHRFVCWRPVSWRFRLYFLVTTFHMRTPLHICSIYYSCPKCLYTRYPKMVVEQWQSSSKNASFPNRRNRFAQDCHL